MYKCHFLLFLILGLPSFPPLTILQCFVRPGAACEWLLSVSVSPLIACSSALFWIDVQGTSLPSCLQVYSTIIPSSRPPPPAFSTFS